MLTGLAVLLAVAAVALVLSRRSVRDSAGWRATVTPLASIIGSGFLVVTPLLAGAVGPWAPVAMAGIVVLAYWVGSASRIVIAELEPGLADRSLPRVLIDLERLSRLLLGFAYVVSVAFYVRLMASFLLRSVGDGELAAQLVATVVLGVIGVVGWLRGLHGLELLEEGAVGTKLAIIAGLLAAMALFALGDPTAVIRAYETDFQGVSGLDTARILAGMLLVVQGFETSRYLGAHYDAERRVASMRHAQLLSGAVYVLFVLLGVRLFGALPVAADETAILDIADELTPVLAPLLVVAAVASQLSAAVADTAGGGEMLTGASRRVPAAGVGYVAVTGAAIAVVWLADVFAIISFASRAFAAYYLSQTLMVLAYTVSSPRSERRRHRLVSYGALVVVLGFVVLFARPAAA